MDKNMKAEGKGVGRPPALPRLERLAAAVRRWHGTARPLAPRQGPAVPVGQSVQPDHLVCLETGQRVTLLLGHLHRMGLTLEEYRHRWNLPADYPTAAASYMTSRAAARAHSDRQDRQENVHPPMGSGYLS